MNGKPKILIISRGEFSGSILSIISALERNGCEVIHVYSTLRNLRLRFFYIILMGINSLLLYKNKFLKYICRTPFSYWIYSKANILLINQQKNIDVIIMIGAYSLTFWKEKKPDILYTVLVDHTNILSKKLPDFGFKAPEKEIHKSWNRIEKKVFDMQDHIFILGSHVKKSLVEDYGINPDKITVIGAGPNLDIDIERDGIKKDYHGKKILFVGIDADRKGLGVLKKAFSKVMEVFPEASLHIVGVEGMNTKDITYYGRLHGEPLKKLFYESQIFALPTLREPFGIVFLEAMLAKNVCIGTNIETIPEIIKHGETGYLIEPNNAEALADRIIDLFSNPTLLERIGEAGYRVTKEKWGWDKAALKIIQQVPTIRS